MTEGQLFVLDLAQATSAISDSAQMMATSAMIVVLLLGLATWLFGGKLLRTTITLCGIALGTAVATVVGARYLEGYVLLAAIAGGMIAGGLLAGLFFRAWMGVSTLIVLALVVPLAHLAWTYDSRAFDRMTDASSGAVAETVDQVDDIVESDNAPQQLAKVIRRVVGRTYRYVDSRWERLSPGIRQTITTVAMGAGLLGLIAGLLLPRIAGAFQTSLVGGVLILGATKQLLLAHVESAGRWAVLEPKPHLVAVGLITAIGLVLQWTLSRSKTDK